MRRLLLLLLLLQHWNLAQAAEVVLGNFRTLQHQVEGTVVALSEQVLEIRNFSYDGTGPAAFFWAFCNSTDRKGFLLEDGAPSRTCGAERLPRADGTQSWRMEIPNGYPTVSEIASSGSGSIHIWCERFSVSFGDLVLEDGLDLTSLSNTQEGPALECSGSTDGPPPLEEIPLGSFTSRAHQLQGDVVARSERVLEVRNFQYDGTGPGAFFWADTAARPSRNGFRLEDGAPSNSCGTRDLPRADGSETWRVEFPEGTSLRDIVGGSIGVWCEDFDENFGEVVVPFTLEGLASTEQGPALECSQGDEPTVSPLAMTPEGYNCEPLYEDLQVRWQVSGQSLKVELVGRIEDFNYMGFGVSGSTNETNMVGADPVVCDFFEGTYRARDFYMSSRAQCSADGNGVCPDVEDDVSDVSGESEEDITVVRYTRPLASSQGNAVEFGQRVDRAINVNPGASTFVVWAVGPVDEVSGLPFFHSIAYPREDVSLEFGRSVVDNCVPFGQEQETEPPVGPPFQRPLLKDVTEFRANIGPSGGARGYEGITEQAGWGISWYLNDLLIPVIEMRRGTTYRFLVNGGDNDQESSRYHPLYLTSSVIGGYAQITPQARAEEVVVAGLEVTNITSDDGFTPLAQGPLCSYETTAATEQAQVSGTYQDFFATLDTSCMQDATITSAAGELEFTPDATTPDTIYYQCVTHRNLGWKIRVIDQDAPSIEQVDCSNFRDDPLILNDGTISLSAIVNPVEGTLTVELVYDGLGWVAMGFTSGAAIMVGSQAVIGLPTPGSQAIPRKYNLNARARAGVQLMPDAQQTLQDASVVQTDTQTILTFTKLLIEEGEHPIFEDEENTFLFAVGSDNNLAVHQNRGGFQLLPKQCLVTVDGVPQNADRTTTGGDGGGEIESNDYRSLWVAHGACASIAWAILVPLAVGSSIIRDVLTSLGLSEGAWFQLHRGLNTLAALLTVAAFSLAVRAINSQPGDAEHFNPDNQVHHTMGLVIFILTLLQAVGGMLRPHLPKPPEEGGDEEALKNAAAAPEKSMTRVMWEYKHRILGAALIAMSWWQVQDGFGLFVLRFPDDNDLTTTFWIVVGSICGSFALAFVIHMALKK